MNSNLHEEEVVLEIEELEERTAPSLIWGD